MRIETTVEVERDVEGPSWRHEDVAVVGDVDLDAETVVIVEPDARFFDPSIQDRMHEALWLEAERRDRAEQRAKALVDDFFATGVVLAKAVAL